MYEHIHDLLDSSAKGYPVKALAAEHPTKAESTLRNELNRQPGYKLGLDDAVWIMEKTGDMRALDEIERLFDRVAFEIPKSSTSSFSVLIKQLSELSKEFGEAVGEIGRSLEDDGEVTGAEVDKCLKEVGDLIERAVQIKAFLQTAKRNERKRFRQVI